ncbi:MAG: carboxypeptidase regulatory-like domain-containing protein [Clostridia bacterium]|nr:carboxypeptidase regulatory-like domain-containing protein [Clostridia bacterium]
MDFEKDYCPIVKVDGFIEKGKQFDLEINLPEDNRNVIYGVIKDCYKDPVENAVVKLIEVCYEYGKEERKPVSHTFTDKDGEFVFGPLCPDKCYEIQVWVDRVKHIKICKECKRQGKCLKGIKLECDDKKCKDDYKCECKKDYKDDYNEDYKDDYKDEHKDDCKKNEKEDCKKDAKDKDDKNDCMPKYNSKYCR